MSFKNYDFITELESAIRLYGGISGVEREFKSILKDYPFENRMLYCGKPYVFDYREDTDKAYDMNPYAISLGPTNRNEPVYYCLNLHCIPYKIRVQVIAMIYNAYRNTIDREIGKYPSWEDARLQKQIDNLTKGNIRNLARKISLMGAVHRYRMDGIMNCRCVNYNRIHMMACSDTDTFANGTIADAQKKFLDGMNS